jgi:hypothetical protein
MMDVSAAQLLARRGGLPRSAVGGLIKELGLAATQAVGEPEGGGVVEDGPAVEEGDAKLGEGMGVRREGVEEAGGGQGGEEEEEEGGRHVSGVNQT